MSSAHAKLASFASLATELKLLITKEAVLEQQEDVDHQDTFVTFLSWKPAGYNMAVAREVLGADEMALGCAWRKTVATRTLERQRTTRINPLLLVCKEFNELFEHVAPAFAATAVNIDLADLLEHDVDAICDQWRRACDISKIRRLRISVGLRRFSRNPLYEDFDIDKRLLITPMLHLYRLLKRFDGVSHREVVFLMPEHGRVAHLERAAETIGRLSHAMLSPPHRHVTQRIRIARACFMEDKVVLHAATNRWRCGALSGSTVDRTKALYPSICWATYPERMTLRDEMLAPVGTWETPKQHGGTNLDDSCSCW